MLDKRKTREKKSSKELIEAMDKFVEKGKRHPNILEKLKKSRREDCG